MLEEWLLSKQDQSVLKSKETRTNQSCHYKNLIPTFGMISEVAVTASGMI